MQSLVKAGIVVLSAVALLLVFGGPASAQEGQSLYASKGCPACHGPQGKNPIMPVYPKLAGQNAEYLVAQLKAFKSQERKSGQSSLMWGMAAQLNEEQMQKIAEWLSGVQ